jgi:hypothetical protein
MSLVFDLCLKERVASPGNCSWAVTKLFAQRQKDSSANKLSFAGD